MSDYRKLHLYHINKQIAVGGDVLDAPLQTPTANLTFARQGSDVTKPSPAGKVDATKEQTDEEIIPFAHKHFISRP